MNRAALKHLSTIALASIVSMGSAHVWAQPQTSPPRTSQAQRTQAQTSQSQASQAQQPPPPPTAPAAPATAGEVTLSAAELLIAPAQIAKPPTLPGAALRLDDAVQMTLRYNATLTRARHELASTVGEAKAARGAFDPIWRVSPGAAYLQQELIPALRRREGDKREQMRIVAETFDSLSRQLADQLASMSPRAPTCPSSFELTSEDPDFVTDRRNELETRNFGFDRDFRQEQAIRVEDGVIRTSIGPIPIISICRPVSETGLDPQIFVDLWRSTSRTANLGLDAILDGFTAIPRETLLLGSELSETVATRARLSLNRLAGLPSDEIRKRLFLEASIAKRLRNGLNLSFDFRVDSEERNFKDKPLDPSFGGFEIPTRFPSFVSLTADVPLLRGRGKRVAAAPERAAALAEQARREQLRHQMTEEAFRTVLAYLNLAASQQTLELLEESARRQQRMITLTQGLIEADEVPKVEIERTRARTASVQQSVEQARLSVLAARLSLLQTLGADARDLSAAPDATERFGELAASLPSLEVLTQLALAERRDPRALDLLRDASRLVTSAATADLRPRVDFRLTAGLTTLYETPFFRFLPDEADPIYSDFETPPVRDTPVRFSSGRGFWRSLDAEWQPFITAMATFELPIGNQRQRGRAQQALAATERAEIDAANLPRLIRDNVAAASGVARSAAESIERRRAAIGFEQDTLDATWARFEAGDVTLLDTVVTEENLTQDQLQLVRDWQVYFSALARLKFETGTLLVFEQVGTPGERVRFPPLTQF